MLAYITAYRRDRRKSENMQLMESLKNDLAKVVGPTEFSCVIARLAGWWKPIYIANVNGWLLINGWLRIDDFLALSRKYGQNTLIFCDSIIDVTTGKEIGKVREVHVRSKTKPEHPRWVHLGGDKYILLETSVPLELMDTLHAWSSGRPVTPASCDTQTR